MRTSYLIHALDISLSQASKGDEPGSPLAIRKLRSQSPADPQCRPPNLARNPAVGVREYASDQPADCHYLGHLQGLHPEVKHAVDRTLRLNLSLSETLLESSSGKVRVRKRHI